MTAALTKPLKWLYQELGMASVRGTGRDAWLIIGSRSLRMFAYGANSLTMALFFASLGFSDVRIGLFMTLTLLGDVALSLGLSLVADRLGRRRILGGGAMFMVMSGAVFLYFENFWILLGAAVIGVVSATGSDFGPFRSVEESTLSHLTTPRTRSDVLSWYVTVSSLGSAAGTELAGRMVDFLKGLDGWQDRHAYHALFGWYVVNGLVCALFACLMSDRCEADDADGEVEKEGAETEAAEGLLGESGDGRHSEEEEGDGEEMDEAGEDEVKRAVEAPAIEDERAATTTTTMTTTTTTTTMTMNPPRPCPPHTSPARARRSWVPRISLATRSIVVRLGFLLAIDSLADGMSSQALTNYYLDRKFGLSKSALGDIASAGYVLMSCSTVLAAPLARRLGLINTMVYTHVPSSAAVLLFPVPATLPLAVALLLLRHALNNMDQAPRAAFIAAVVRPEERTAVMGVLGMLRTLGAAVGPTITGFLADARVFWVAFVVAGAARLAYDFGLFFMFVNVPLHAHEPGKSASGRHRDEEEEEEMQPMRQTQ